MWGAGEYGYQIYGLKQSRYLEDTHTTELSFSDLIIKSIASTKRTVLVFSEPVFSFKNIFQRIVERVGNTIGITSRSNNNLTANSRSDSDLSVLNRSVKSEIN